MAVVTFGDTKALQGGGRVRGFAPNRTLMICNLGDIICAGWMVVVPTHLDYSTRVPEALSFLITQIATNALYTPLMLGRFP